MDIQPLMLEGRYVRLAPLQAGHLEDLLEVGLEPALWKWTLGFVASREDLANYIDAALAEQAAGASVPFAVVHRETGKAVGSTRYMSIAAAHRRLEIGSTWYGIPYQRTPVNTESKYLLLTHAFERLGCRRVELKTDALNEKSRRAIERLGAVHEGVFRKHVECYGGRVRDSAWYSIVDDEWPAVKARLEGLLAR